MSQPGAEMPITPELKPQMNADEQQSAISSQLSAVSYQLPALPSLLIADC
jgi:hypothetical protein